MGMPKDLSFLLNRLTEEIDAVDGYVDDARRAVAEAANRLVLAKRYFNLVWDAFEELSKDGNGD